MMTYFIASFDLRILCLNEPKQLLQHKSPFSNMPTDPYPICFLHAFPRPPGGEFPCIYGFAPAVASMESNQVQ
jgi:hypothetical protein